MNNKPTSCKAIIKHGDKFLLYLRDDKPTIPFPDYWDFFGGGLEQGESLKECIEREIFEELEIRLDLQYVETIAEETAPIRYVAVFTADLTDLDLQKLHFTGEGQKYGEFSSEELKDMKTIPHFRRYL